MKLPVAVASLLIATLAAVAYQTGTRHRVVAASDSLTEYVPQDALLSIESPDFAAVLHRWTGSAESKAWLASDDYAVLANSGLFTHLASFQDEFAKAAGMPVGSSLLDQVAGTQSVFAWYDVRELEFLYITRMPAAQASQTALLQSRAGFERRHAGNADFYLRTYASEGATRTVAFAQASTPSGDLLLLSTREDLIANALALIAANAPVQSLSREPWFQDASAALPSEKSPPALHMVLNLDRIVPMPSFRSYWVQQNITWMGQYRAAVSDLYLESSDFREERVLLPKAAAETVANTTNIGALAALAPPTTGVFRAVATNDPSDAVTAIQEKLLGSYAAERTNPESAPDPDLETPQPGAASDLETRIDTPAPVPPTASYDALKQVLEDAHLDAVLTLSSAQAPTASESLWVPIHSAVVLHGSSAWDANALASALQQSLRGSLTAASLGIDFHPVQVAGQTIYALTGPRPLFFAIPSSPAKASLVLLSDDQPLLLAILRKVALEPTTSNSSATLIAGFDHRGQRAPYSRLTSLIDGTNPKPSGTGTPTDASAAATAAPGVQPRTTPAFFSRNLRSLSDTFASLESERLVEQSVDSNLRQTVTYQWQQP